MDGDAVIVRERIERVTITPSASGCDVVTRETETIERTITRDDAAQLGESGCDLGWSDLVARMRSALTPAERARFDSMADARRVERDAAVGLAHAQGWMDGRVALGRDIAAARAAKLAGLPRPAPTPGPSKPTTPIADFTPAESPTTPPPISRPRRRRYDGAVRLGRVSVPETLRERTIVQVPIDDAAERGGNSLVYGFGLRTIMAIGRCTRRLAGEAIRLGRVNPHDPVDVVRWGMQRRDFNPEALASVAELAAATRETRNRVTLHGIDVDAATMAETEPAAGGSMAACATEHASPPSRVITETDLETASDST